MIILRIFIFLIAWVNLIFYYELYSFFTPLAVISLCRVTCKEDMWGNGYEGRREVCRWRVMNETRREIRREMWTALGWLSKLPLASFCYGSANFKGFVTVTSRGWWRGVVCLSVKRPCIPRAMTLCKLVFLVRLFHEQRNRKLLNNFSVNIH
jgi:hypothetical protein